ncbi:SIR2 family protein [Nitrococcus mobilis]|uniref:TPR domain protein n=1 Tax=Nitrococcus mobilis Nb-231 TaxID=314278 RepID=A4BQA4_9GAMM|nr:SIR2 family protein [Nitrococcus mobilis]EAR22259.1 TPR domain protein [Nitrococcus mobilis Nb-231]
MSILAKDQHTQLAFALYENPGVFAVLLGSGLSRSAEIPTGWEITLDLIRRVALAQGVEAQPDWAKWYREETGHEPSYSALLEELASSPDERRSILHSYIEPTDQDREEWKKVPTPAHEALADLVRAGYVRVIVTTNFDRLMENALREHGVEPTIVASVDALKGAEPLAHSACYILKLHGDYKDARILNTDEELSGYTAEYDALLDRIFDEYGLIVCGWSGEWDHALRAAFLRAPNRRYPMYWGARGKPGTGAGEIITHRGARLVEITDADSFFTGLWQRVQTLEQTHRQNPLGVDLLVNSTKRYLAKPEYRIQLDELFSQETERLIEQIDSSAFAAQGGWNQDEFCRRVALYEAATEPLARMAGVLGRWGDGSELSLVVDVLSAIRVHADKVGGGLTVWLNIRTYPVVLIFTAYGLGLVPFSTLADASSPAIGIHLPRAP